MRIDLHSHTRHSDGELEPRALVERAVGADLTHLAITDHDTVSALADAAVHAKAAGLALVPGIELTVEWRRRELHVLGHFVVPAALAPFCARLVVDRTERIHAMIERLAAAQVRVSFDEVLEVSGGGALGRPHLARVLVRRGYAAGVGDAFRRWLGPGCPGDAPRARPSLAEGIAAIRAAGGTASLAHPGVNGIRRPEVPDLAAEGLDALEAFHPDHPPSQQDAYVRWADAAGMTATGGSDFHGPEAKPRFGLGAFVTPAAAFRRLAALAQTRRSAVDAALRAGWDAASPWPAVAG